MPTSNSPDPAEDAAERDDAPLIHVMSAPLANKIAAGEVVQRPASAVKELVENSIDAGASQVDVIVQQAGRELLQVVDDGCGMGRRDAELSLERHATSKIRSVEDLERIRTFGFRGEALASISAVTQLEIRTRRRTDAQGWRIRVEGGVQVEDGPCATPPGTSIAARNLFYNVPARRNFLKSPATEYRHIAETVRFMALAHPRVGFSFVHDGNEVYRLPAVSARDPFDALRARVAQLFGSERAEALVRVDERVSYAHLRGFVGPPGSHKRTRGDQYLFVNDRYVKHRYLEHAVSAAYGAALPSGAHPFFVLAIDVDPAHVDVNVHPTKAEVKFDDEPGLYGYLLSSVRRALAATGRALALDDAPASVDDIPSPRPAAFGGAPPAPRTDTPAPRTASFGSFSTSERPRRQEGGLRAKELDSDARRTSPAASLDLYDIDASAAPRAGTPREAAPAEAAPPGASGRVWQLHDRYLVTSFDGGLMLVDQRAAHERILYERALASLDSGSGPSQQLLFPETVELEPGALALIEEVRDELAGLGFDIERFGGHSVVVRGVPADVPAGSEKSILSDVLGQFRENRGALRLKARDNLARAFASRMAIRPGTRLGAPEASALLEALWACEMPYATPGGRSTMLRMTLEEIARRMEA